MVQCERRSRAVRTDRLGGAIGVQIALVRAVRVVELPVRERHVEQRVRLCLALSALHCAIQRDATQRTNVI